MKVLVLGSSRGDGGIDAEKHFISACRALATELLSKGHHILICGTSAKTSDDTCGRTASSNKEWRQRCTLYLRAASEQTETEPDWSKKVTTHLCDGEWREVHLTAIRDADVLVVLGGGEHTRTVVYSASLLRRGLILLPSFGGAGASAWKDFSSYYTPQHKQELLADWRPSDSDWASRVVTIATSIHRSNPFVRNAPWATALKAVLLLGCLALWTLITLTHTTVGSVPLTLLISFLSAAVAGVILRRSLIAVGAINPQWIAVGVIDDLLIGIGVAFALFLLTQAGKVVIDGKVLMDGPSEDVRRIAITLSLLGFVGSLFVDKAWGRVSREASRVIER